MAKNLISVSMIVRDGAAHLERALQSAHLLGDLLDEICIVDTGSVDGSQEIARRQGARLQEIPWADDFAAARNAALEMVRAPWALVLDADEWFDADVDKLAGWLTGADELGVTALRVMHSNLSSMGEPLSSVVQIRLLRVGKVRYHGRVHEHVVSTGPQEMVDAAVDADVMEVWHAGYQDARRTDEKVHRNLGIIESALADQSTTDDERQRLAWQHARTLYRLDQAAAIAELQQIGAGNGPYVVHALEYLAHCLMDDEAWAEAISVVERLTEVTGNRPFASFLLARWCLASGELQTGLELLRDLQWVHTTDGLLIPRSMIFGTRARAAEELGLWDEALTCRLALLAESPVAQVDVDEALRLWGKRPLPALMTLLTDVLAQAEDASAVTERICDSPAARPELRRMVRQRWFG